MSRQGSSAATADPGITGLTYQRCRWCATAFIRRLLCPACASSDFDNIHGDGVGVVVKTAVVHRYSRTPRNESLVRFPEGFTLPCRIVGTDPRLVHPGARVRPAAGCDPNAGAAVFELCEPLRVSW